MPRRCSRRSPAGRTGTASTKTTSGQTSSAFRTRGVRSCTGQTIRATWAARAASVAWMSSQSGRAKAPARPRASHRRLHRAPRRAARPVRLGTRGERQRLTRRSRRSRSKAVRRRARSWSGSRISATRSWPARRSTPRRSLAATPPWRAIAPEAQTSGSRISTRASCRGASGAGRGWFALSPAGGRRREVFRGQDIFGGRRPHIATAGAERLWETVGVRVPGLDDCAAVLRELASEKTTPAPQGTLIAIYQHLAGLVGEAKTACAKSAGITSALD